MTESTKAEVTREHRENAAELVLRIAHPLDSRGAEAARQHNGVLLAQAIADAEARGAESHPAPEASDGDGWEVWVVHSPAGIPCDVRLSQSEADGAIANAGETVVRYAPASRVRAEQAGAWVKPAGELPATGTYAWISWNGVVQQQPWVFEYVEDDEKEGLNWYFDGHILGMGEIDAYLPLSLPAPPAQQPTDGETK